MSNTSGNANSNTPAVGPSKVTDLGVRAALEAMLSGVQQAIPDGSEVLVAGAKLMKADMVAKLQGFLSQYSAIATQAAELKADRQGLRQSLPEVRQLLQELKDAMIVAFGRSSPEIQKFGLRGRTARKLTSEQRALAAEKARRTRALRGTKGSRQKAAIRFAGQPTLVLGPGETPAETSPAAVAAKPPVA
jgi:type I site-specific restriction endonuclease